MGERRREDEDEEGEEHGAQLLHLTAAARMSSSNKLWVHQRVRTLSMAAPGEGGGKERKKGWGVAGARFSAKERGGDGVWGLPDQTEKGRAGKKK